MDELALVNQKHYSEWSMNTSETRLRIARQFIEQENPRRILDVACSGGEFTAQFISPACEVHGIDVSELKVKAAATRGLRAQQQDLSGRWSNATESNSMDLVFAGEIIEHLVDTDLLLQNIFKTLKPGGALVLTTPNLLSLENRVRMLFGTYPRWVDWSLSSSDVGHVRAYNFKVLKKQLKQNGFAVEKMRGNYVPITKNTFFGLDDRRHNWVRFSGRLFPRLSQTIIVLARKPS